MPPFFFVAGIEPQAERDYASAKQRALIDKRIMYIRGVLLEYRNDYRCIRSYEYPTCRTDTSELQR